VPTQIAGYSFLKNVFERNAMIVPNPLDVKCFVSFIPGAFYTEF